MRLFGVRLLLALIACGLMLAYCTTGTGDDTKNKEKSASAQEGIPHPGPEHELLKQFEGTWDASVKTYMGPGEPNQARGTERNRMGMGGLWLLQDFRADFMGMQFEGHGFIGYDSAKKKYVGTWIDSMQTFILASEGSFDNTHKVFTQTAEGPDPSGKMTKWRMVTVFKDPDHHEFTMSRVFEGRKDATEMVISYERKKEPTPPRRKPKRGK
jgi:hypothetical protein